MQGLFRRIWQWITSFFGQLFGSRSIGPSSSLSVRRRTDQGESAPPLTDTDYEFLFMQLMEGIGHGWHEGRIVKFFNNLGEQGKQKKWAVWLERFGEKVLSSSAPNQLLAARMLRLGELAQTIPKIQLIGETSYRIGRELYNKNQKNSVWEYDGPDTSQTEMKTSAPVISLQPQMSIDASEDTIPNPPPEALTIDELLERLQHDSNLAQTLAQQLGIQTNDPQEIVNVLIEQFQQVQNQEYPTQEPSSVDEWFQRGVQQAEMADWEGAIASWDQALALDPDLAEAWHNRSSALAYLGRLDEALESINKALELDADDPQIWNSRGSVLFSLQRWEDCLVCWDKLIELQEDYYQGWYNRGFTLENMGRNEEAIASYHKALEIEPNFELAKIKLQDLLGQNQNEQN
ncbi:tetratricopeptide repeat protein [Gloeothece verrucosa]|uniref:Tetratricopeptide TPR_2 repeat protein n=1 Tax=Gloeothece verrucosa (strain PCC 7822) TaxID=497965 RepID=E0UJP0_GLOV7|nr:tetratricopeptide repeat protein [Gloeothece verrucosa]ADN12284.1 Tetratricopeptide TPR_2 repeat protein [Gloeothece verrucosa PCC 7822]